MANDNHPPPQRPTSLRALQAVRWVALGSSALCGLAFGLGTYPDALASGGALGCIIPFGVAVVAAAGLGTGWHFTLGIAAHAEETHKRALAACLGVGLFAIGCASSAWFLTGKIGGATAVQDYQLVHVEKLRRAAEVVGVNASLEQGLVGAIQSGGSGVRNTAESENAAGLVSGRRGKDVVYRTLNDAADKLVKMAGTLQTLAEDRDDRLKRARRDLAEASRAAAMRDTAQFEEAASRAASEISAADQTPLMATASSLRVGMIVDHARAPIDAVFDEIAKVQRLVNDNRRDVSVPVYVPIDAKQAVIVNPPVLAWIAALLIEALPLLMLGLMLVLWREEPDDENGPAFRAAPIPEPRPRPSLVAAE